MKFIRTVVILAILFSLPCCKSHDNSFAVNCEECNIVGATYVVFNANKILNEGSYGIRSVNDDTSYVQLSDRFHIASNTKAITALFAAKLVEGKKIEWNTRFFDVFPDLKSQSRQDYWNITLQDLLCHRAHIQPYLTLSSTDSIFNFTGDICEK